MSPSHVRQLVREGFKVLVQPSSRRAYTAMEYRLNGAVIQEDLSEAQAIFGVKIIPPERILPNKRYAFFSHTIKAQPENMIVLDTLVAKVGSSYYLRELVLRQSHYHIPLTRALVYIYTAEIRHFLSKGTYWWNYW